MHESEEKLNLIRQWNAFNVKRIGVLKPASVALYITLLDIANRASHEGGVLTTIAVDNERLLKLSGIGNKKTLAAHRKELVTNGFVIYTRGSRGISGRYRLVKLY